MARERNYFFRVTATGLDDLEKQFTSLGSTGAAAFEKLKSASPQFVDAWKRAQAEVEAARKKAENDNRAIAKFAAGADQAELAAKKAGRALSDVRGATELLAPVAGEAGEKLGFLVGQMQNLSDVFGVAANIVGRTPLAALATVAGIAATAIISLAKNTDEYSRAQEEANAISGRSADTLKSLASATNATDAAKRAAIRTDVDRARVLRDEASAAAAVARAQADAQRFSLVGTDMLGDQTAGLNESLAERRLSGVAKALQEAQAALAAFDRQIRLTSLAKIATDAQAARDKIDPLGAATREYFASVAALDELYEQGEVPRAKYFEYFGFLRSRYQEAKDALDPYIQSVRALAAANSDAVLADQINASAGDTARERRAAREAFQGLSDTYDTAGKRAREYEEAQRLVNDAVRLNPELAGRAAAVMQGLKNQYTDAGRAARDFAAANSDAILADQIQDAGEAAARRRVADRVREGQLLQSIERAEAEVGIAALKTNQEREVARALLEAQNRLIDEQGIKIRDLSDEEKERISNATRQKVALDEQRQAAEKFAKDMERTIVRSTDRAVDFAADTLYDTFTGKITSIGDFLKTTLLRAAAQVAAEMVFRPIIAPIISAGVQAVAQAGFGSMLGINAPGAATAAGGGGVGLGTVAGAASIGYQVNNAGGFWNALGNPFGLGSSASGGTVLAGTSGDALRAFDAAQGAAYGANSFEATAAAASGSSGIGSALSAIAPYATIAGGLFGAYNAVTNPTPTNIIAGLGGLYAGVSAGMGLAGLGALPFAGPIGLAAAAVGIIGSLFGGGKKGPTVVHADQTSRDVSFYSDGTIEDRAGPRGYYGANPSMYDGLTANFKTLGDAVRKLGGTPATYGFNATYDTVLYGSQGKIHAGITDSKGNTQYIQSNGNMEAFGVATMKALLNVSEGIDDVYKTVAENSEAGTLKDFASDLDFAKNLKDSIAALGDLSDSLDKVTAAAKKSAVEMVDQLGEIETRADDLGLGDMAHEAATKQIRAWMGLQGPQQAPTATQQALARIAGAFDGLGESGEKYGITKAEVDAAEAKAVAGVRTQFEDAIAAILDPAGAALRAFDRSADQMRQDARDLGADLVETEKAIAKQRQAVADQALGGLATNLRSFLDGQLLSDTSSLSPEARLAAAQGQFDAALTGARNGDAYQSSRLVSSAQELLSQGRAFYGSTSDYATLEAFTRSTLQSFGAQKGWDGFGAAIQSQTSALINAEQLGAQAIVDELKVLQDRVAALVNQLSNLRAKSFAA